MRETLVELWRHRDLILSFALRDIKTRYKQTALGVAWAVLQPFSMMLVFSMVFSVFAKVPSDGVPYPVFVYSALLFWTFFSSVLNGGTTSMVSNSPLIRKIYFPRQTLLLSSLIASTLDLLVASTIFGAMLAYYHVRLTVTALWVFPLFALELFFALGVISFTSALHVNFRDIGHGLPLLVQIWMFASPVAYPLSLIPEWLRPYYMLNPMAPIIDGYRRAILHGLPPDPRALATAAAGIVVFTCLALITFKRAERTFADVI